MSAYHRLYVHLVWATARRHPFLDEAAAPRFHAVIAAKCRDLDCPPMAVGGMPDHVHVLVALSPAVSVARLAGQIKGASSHLMTHEVGCAGFRWQRGYGVFSLRAEEVPVVQDYISRQAEHHAGGSEEPAWEPPEEPNAAA